jgi:hypothetical protein
MFTSEVKKILIDILIEKAQAHQEARAAISEEVVNAFLTPRKLYF